jgi:glycosyltransferase involved in cell wall biosynthesis
VALVSIITIVKDNEIGLGRTYSSLSMQTSLNWEMLIVIAPSIDNSIELAKKLSDENDNVHVIQQQSYGIFSAMNEGLDHANGEFVWFMNSGDVFAGPQVLELATEEIERQSVGVVIGAYQITHNDAIRKFIYRRNKITPLRFAFTRRGGCHQAMIFRTDYIKEVGGFNLQYKFNSDFLLVLKVIEMGGGQRVSEVYADVELGGLADQNIFTVHSEKHEIRASFFDHRLVFFLSKSWTFAARTKIQFRTVIREICSKYKPSR